MKGIMNAAELEINYLGSGWEVDRVIVLAAKTERLVVIRFGHSTAPRTREMDAALVNVAKHTVKLAAVYAVDRKQVPDFDELYCLEADGDFCVMFFWDNKLIKVDTHTGNTDKILFVMGEKDLLDVITEVYRTAQKGLMKCVTEKNFSNLQR